MTVSGSKATGGFNAGAMSAGVTPILGQPLIVFYQKRRSEALFVLHCAHRLIGVSVGLILPRLP